MHQKGFQVGGILLLSIGLVSGRASANQATTTSDDIDLDDVVEMVVLNRTPNPVSMFVMWESGVRLRLGELGIRSNRTFTTPLRDRGVWLWVRWGMVGGRDRPEFFVPVRPGDRIEWEIRQTNPAIELFYRRLPPRPNLAGGGIPAIAWGRQPFAGDLLRVECFSPQDQGGRIAEGLFEGAGGGELLLSVGLQGQRVAVPVVNVTRVEVRRRRTRSGGGGLIGALLGAAAGAVIGDSKYDPESAFHYRRGIYGVAGGVAGAVGGLAVGALIGYFIKNDVWLEVPQNWVVRYSGSGSTTQEGSARPTLGC